MKHTAPREVIERLYVAEGRMLEDVAATLGMSRPSLRRIMREYGVPSRPKGTQYLSVEERIAKQSDGCWIWMGYRNRAGYGWMRTGKRNSLVHRFMYERAKGPIPDGLNLDHLCRTPACVNPDHLEPVTQGENMRRARPFRTYVRGTHCQRGHPKALYRSKNRGCLMCMREQYYERRDALRGLGSDPTVRGGSTEVGNRS